MAKHRLLRFGVVAGAALCLLTAHALSSDVRSAAAEEIQVEGPLAGAPAVMDLRNWRKNKIQLEPYFGFTFGDEYSRALMLGVEARYSFIDWLGIGAWGAFSVANPDTNLTDQVQAEGVTTNRNRLSLPSRENFPDQVGTIDWMAGIDLQFTPLRGKLAMFQKVFIDTDLSFFAGVAFVGLTERSDSEIFFNGAGVQYCAPPGDGADESDIGCLESQTARSSRIAVAPSFGVSFNTYFHKFVGVAIRWRGIPFKWNTSGTDESGSESGVFPDGVINKQDRLRHFNQVFSVGIIFVLPPN